MDFSHCVICALDFNCIKDLDFICFYGSFLEFIRLRLLSTRDFLYFNDYSPPIRISCSKTVCQLIKYRIVSVV